MTTGIDAIRAAVEGRMATEWAATTKVLHGNRMPRTLQDAAGAEPTEFVLIEVVVADISQASIGDAASRRFRHEGFIWAHIFTPIGEGEGRANELADLLGEIFVGQEFGGVICYGMSLGEGQAGDDAGRYWRKSAKFQFYYDKLM